MVLLGKTFEAFLSAPICSAAAVGLPGLSLYKWHQKNHPPADHLCLMNSVAQLENAAHPSAVMALEKQGEKKNSLIGFYQVISQ